MNLKKLNVILVYNKSENKILMCKRAKEPYKGKYNLVGGKQSQMKMNCMLPTENQKKKQE